MKPRFITYCLSLLLFLGSAAVNGVFAQEDEDWKLVVRNVKIVNIERGESRKGDIYKNVINHRYAILPEPGKNHMMYLVEYSDLPSYKYMFRYGSEYFGEKWYFNVNIELKLPIEYDLEFVRVVKAFSGSNSRYFRLFRSVVDHSLTIKTDDPAFGCIVYRSDNPRYEYMFSLSGIDWYFSLVESSVTNAGTQVGASSQGNSQGLLGNNHKIKILKFEGTAYIEDCPAKVAITIFQSYQADTFTYKANVKYVSVGDVTRLDGQLEWRPLEQRYDLILSNSLDSLKEIWTIPLERGTDLSSYNSLRCRVDDMLGSWPATLKRVDTK